MSEEWKKQFREMSNKRYEELMAMEVPIAVVKPVKIERSKEKEPHAKDTKGKETVKKEPKRGTAEWREMIKKVHARRQALQDARASLGLEISSNEEEQEDDPLETLGESSTAATHRQKKVSIDTHLPNLNKSVEEPYQVLDKRPREKEESTRKFAEIDREGEGIKKKKEEETRDNVPDLRRDRKATLRARPSRNVTRTQYKQNESREKVIEIDQDTMCKEVKNREKEKIDVRGKERAKRIPAAETRTSPRRPRQEANHSDARDEQRSERSKSGEAIPMEEGQDTSKEQSPAAAKKIKQGEGKEPRKKIRQEEHEHPEITEKKRILKKMIIRGE